MYMYDPVMRVRVVVGYQCRTYTWIQLFVRLTELSRMKLTAVVMGKG